jgi:histidinol-phosphate aminotransferase
MNDQSRLIAARPVPREEVMKIAAYVSGESKVAGVNRIVKLSSNEGAFGPPPGAQVAFAKVAPEMHRYPDGASTELRRAIGARFGLDPERIVCGTGSDELIQHLCHIYSGPGVDILMSMHGFSMYQISGTYAGARVIKVPERNLTVDVDAMLANVTPETRIVFIANPNNPTGTLLPQSEVERLRAGLPNDVLLVLDAAYAEYVDDPDYDPGVAMVDAGENTVMLRTFSKVFGMGGMRVGWCYAPAEVVDALNRVRGVFNVNIAAQAAAVAALAEPGWVEASVAHNTKWRTWLMAALEAVGIKTWPSVGNFFLADFASPERAAQANEYLKSRGIILRAMGGYGLPNTLRITIGTEEECRMVAAALADFMAGVPACGSMDHV